MVGTRNEEHHQCQVVGSVSAYEMTETVVIIHVKQFTYECSQNENVLKSEKQIALQVDFEIV